MVKPVYNYEGFAPVLGKPVNSSWNKLIENDKGNLHKNECSLALVI